jgi:bifunctional non-homologous end joining protein LigD
MRPMLATPGTTPPSGPDWVHEVKWDGMRVLVDVTHDATGIGRVVARSRNENDVTVSFPELAGLADVLDDALLDGELVAFADGIPTFGALADRMHVRSPRRAAELATRNPVTLLVFDLLRLNGTDVTRRSLRERRDLLEALGLTGPRWQVPAWYDDGESLMSATQQQGLEGVVSKRLSSHYHPGRRSADWLKFPHRATRACLVGGWRLETDSETRLGAVLVGEPGPDGLAYRGRVGSGIAGQAGRRLQTLLEPLTRTGSPFADAVPAVDARGTVWVEPEVVVDIACLGLTPAGRLRQPSYRGVRRDLDAADLAAADV